jgi:hypothetical protein
LVSQAVFRRPRRCLPVFRRPPAHRLLILAIIEGQCALFSITLQ